MNTKNIALLAAIVAVAAIAIVAIPTDDVDAADQLKIDVTVDEFPPGFVYVKIQFNKDVESATVVINDGTESRSFDSTMVGIVDQKMSISYKGTVAEAYTVSVTATTADGVETAKWPAATPETYTVAYEQTVENGTVAVYNGEDLVEPNGTIPATVTELTVVVTPAEGVDVESVKVNGTDAILADGVYTSTVAVEGNVTITVVVNEAQPVYVTYTIASNNADWGTVSMDEVTVTAGTEPVINGATVTIGGTVVTATPAAADEQYTYSFVEWTVNGTEITAVFEQKPITVDPADPDREFTNQIILADGAVIDEKSSIDASYTQEVLVTGDVKVIDGGEIFISGKLTVQDGASLEIVSGGKVIVYGSGIVDVQGDLVAEAGTDGATFQYGGCKMTVAGTVILEGADSFTSTGKGIEVSGLFEVGEEATAVIDDMTVAEGGELAVYGTVEGDVMNYGTVLIDSEGVSGADGTVGVDMYIYLMSVNAEVDAANVCGYVYVSDWYFTFKYQGEDHELVTENGVDLYDVSGVKVTMSVEYKNEDGVRNGYGTMYLSGSIGAATVWNDDTTGMEPVVNVYDADDVVIAADSSFDGVDVYVAGNLTVEATVTVDEESSITVGYDYYDGMAADSSSITVTGKLTADAEIKIHEGSAESVVNAAMYSTGTGSDKVYVYTTLETALADGATDIIVTGTVTIKGDITIPVGTTVDVRNAKEVTIEEQATVTVEAADRKSGKLTTSTTPDYIVVDGTLVVQDLSKSGLKEVAVLSDTFNKADDAVTYTNIYSAVASAADGETIEVSRGAPLTLEKDLTIPEGVTLSIPENERVLVDNGVTLTVNGKLDVAGYYVMEPEVEADPDNGVAYEAAGATVVNGMMQYTNDADYTAYIVGAYYTYDGKSTITPLATAAELVNDIEEDPYGMFSIYLYGDIAVGDIVFDYSGEEMVILIVDEDSSLEAGTVTLGGIGLEANGPVTATVAMANATVSLDNVYGVYMVDVHRYVDDDLVSISAITGFAINADDPDTTATETGSVTVASGSLSVIEFGTATAVDFTVASGATATVYSAGFAGDVLVDGTMALAAKEVAIEEGDSLVPGSVTFQTVTVMGTFSAEESRTASFRTLYVGVTADDFGIGGQASVDGLVPYNDVYAVAYVSPGSVVGESFDALKSTEYYVEDALYITVYANKSNDVAIDGVQVEPENALFQHWYAVVDDKVVVIDYSDYPNHTVGAFDKVFAQINYKIYSIYVVAGNGVGTVAVNGVVMEKDGNNTFTMSGLVAGTYTITYTVKTGYEGTSTMTVDGKVIDGKVTLSGTDVRSVTVNLSDVEPNYTAPVEKEDPGMGLTDYLLIVLVILIVVMAVIVALRMMRS